jgi:Cupin
MPAPPENLADRPAPPAGLPRPPREFADHPAPQDAAADPGGNSRPRDLLPELPRSVRLRGERVVAHGPLRTFSAGFAGIGALHIVDEGEVVLRIDGVPHVERASHGDVILLPRGDPHHISDAGEQAHATVRAGVSRDNAPQPARWLCGTFTIGDPQASHLLASLPAAIIRRGDRGRHSKGSTWPAGCSWPRCNRPLKDRR